MRVKVWGEGLLLLLVLVAALGAIATGLSWLYQFIGAMAELVTELSGRGML